MPDRAYLVLEDGTVYAGEPFGAPVEATGEVVFNTSMTGYQEALTDPSYAGQMLVMTYPLQGNYGTNGRDDESGRVQVSAFIVREHCLAPSHRLMTATLHDYLVARRRRVRARVTQGSPEAALERRRDSARYGTVDLVPAVSAERPFAWPPAGAYAPVEAAAPEHRVVVLDLGVKYNIMRSLRRLGCDVMAVPAKPTAESIPAPRPEGVVLSPGPGPGARPEYAAPTPRRVGCSGNGGGRCLGHQVV